ncbi:MAG: hypothetical protein H7066_22235 [Cytophagaceae bacterium]|nr:hypothetical protein [Gemmatimonadaceae bacterium]
MITTVIPHGFVVDDPGISLRNPLVQQPATAWQAFLQPYWPAAAALCSKERAIMVPFLAVLADLLSVASTQRSQRKALYGGYALVSVAWGLAYWVAGPTLRAANQVDAADREFASLRRTPEPHVVQR